MEWSPPVDASVTTTEPSDVRVVTWNAWFGEHEFEARRRALLDELACRKADVIALQEVTPELLDDLCDEPWVRSAYRLSDVQLMQSYDVVLLSRLPVRRFGSLVLPSQMGRRLVVAELACGLVVATVHLESMKGYERTRALQLELIQPALIELGDDAVLVGDMNFQPGDPLETEAMDPGFVDVWPVLHPADPGYTVDGERNLMRYAAEAGLSRKRIDRVFLRSRRWRPLSIELLGTAAIDAGGNHVSDHFGLAVALEVTP